MANLWHVRVQSIFVISCWLKLEVHSVRCIDRLLHADKTNRLRVTIRYDTRV